MTEFLIVGLLGTYCVDPAVMESPQRIQLLICYVLTPYGVRTCWFGRGAETDAKSWGLNWLAAPLLTMLTIEHPAFSETHLQVFLGNRTLLFFLEQFLLGQLSLVPPEASRHKHKYTQKSRQINTLPSLSLLDWQKCKQLLCNYETGEKWFLTLSPLDPFDPITPGSP